MREWHGSKQKSFGKIKINIFRKHGDLIFFDWIDEETGEQTGEADHVGIVKRSDNGIVYTIEGNTTGDICKQKQYDIDSIAILGYGTPNY